MTKAVSIMIPTSHQKFQVLKMQVLNFTWLILGLGYTLHKPYPYSLYRCVPPFALVPEMFGELTIQLADHTTTTKTNFQTEFSLRIHKGTASLHEFFPGRSGSRAGVLRFIGVMVLWWLQVAMFFFGK